MDDDASVRSVVEAILSSAGFRHAGGGRRERGDRARRPRAAGPRPARRPDAEPLRLGGLRDAPEPSGDLFDPGRHADGEVGDPGFRRGPPGRRRRLRHEALHERASRRGGGIRPRRAGTHALRAPRPGAAGAPDARPPPRLSHGSPDHSGRRRRPAGEAPRGPGSRGPSHRRRRGRIPRGPLRLGASRRGRAGGRQRAPPARRDPLLDERPPRGVPAGLVGSRRFRRPSVGPGRGRGLRPARAEGPAGRGIARGAPRRTVPRPGPPAARGDRRGLAAEVQPAGPGRAARGTRPGGGGGRRLHEGGRASRLAAGRSSPRS